MKSQIERIRYMVKEVKAMHTLIEKECDDILNITNSKLKSLTYSEAIKIFGEFEYKELGGGRILITDNWRNENIKLLEINNHKIWIHKLIFGQIAGAIADVIGSGLERELDFTNGGGGFVSRHKMWDINRSLSLHSFGCAIDFNPTLYPFGSDKRINQGVVDIFKRWKFIYGGDWSIKDVHHFEWAGFIL